MIPDECPRRAGGQGPRRCGLRLACRHHCDHPGESNQAPGAPARRARRAVADDCALDVADRVAATGRPLPWTLVGALQGISAAAARRAAGRGIAKLQRAIG